MFVFLVASFHVSSQTTPTPDSNVKAVFLYNFTQFVKWSSEAEDEQKPFIIGILGEDPFGTFIDETVVGAKVKSRAVVVQRYSSTKDITGCSILYISISEAAKVKEILTALPQKNLLTVSDIPDFARAGGMIRFIKLDGKIKLQINNSVAKAADIHISSKLLRLANIVGR